MSAGKNSGDHDPMDLMAYMDRSILTGQPQASPAMLEDCRVPGDLREVALDVINFVERVTAAPGQSLEVALSGSTAFVIANEEVPDAADGSDKKLVARQAVAFKLCAAKGVADLDAFLTGRVRDALLALARHEVDEWLRVDGLRLRDPHPHQGKTRSTWVSPPPCAADCWCRR